MCVYLRSISVSQRKRCEQQAKQARRSVSIFAHTQTDGILQPSQKFARKIASSYLECASTTRIVVFGWLCFETRKCAEKQAPAGRHKALSLSRNKMRLLQTMNARARRSGGQVLLWSKRRINLNEPAGPRTVGCGSAFVFALKVFGGRAIISTLH